MDERTFVEPSSLPGFVRPRIERVEYRDGNGDVIPYGNRWPDRHPAQDSYSRTLHPERFQPIHTVAAALIDYLSATYDVTVTEDADAANDFISPWRNFLRVVRLQPADPDAASLTLAFTDFPHVSAHAGMTSDLVFLDCGCDACDETWESVADEMEEKVSFIVGGGFTEMVGVGKEPPHETSFRDAEGNEASSTWSVADEAVLKRTEDVGIQLPWTKTWKAWARR